MVGKRLRKNNSAIALNILYTKEKGVCLAYISKFIWNCEKKDPINDSKRRKRRMALSCSKTTVYTIKRSNIKTSW